MVEVINVNDNGVEVLGIFFIRDDLDVSLWVDNSRLMHSKNLYNFFHYPRPCIALMHARHFAND